MTEIRDTARELALYLAAESKKRGLTLTQFLETIAEKEAAYQEGWAEATGRCFCGKVVMAGAACHATLDDGFNHRADGCGPPSLPDVSGVTNRQRSPLGRTGFCMNDQHDKCDGNWRVMHPDRAADLVPCACDCHEATPVTEEVTDRAQFIPCAICGVGPARPVGGGHLCGLHLKEFERFVEGKPTPRSGIAGVEESGLPVETPSAAQAETPSTPASSYPEEVTEPQPSLDGIRMQRYLEVIGENVRLHGFLRDIARTLGLDEVESYDDVCKAVERSVGSAPREDGRSVEDDVTFLRNAMKDILKLIPDAQYAGENAQHIARIALSATSNSGVTERQHSREPFGRSEYLKFGTGEETAHGGSS